MKLVELETIGVRGLADGSYAAREVDGSPSRFVVVTGPSGAGCTTFVDAIAFAAGRLANAGPVDPSQVVRAGGTVAAIRTAWFVDDDELRYGGLSEQVTRAQVNFDGGGLATVDADPGLLGLMSRYDHAPEHSKVVLFPARRVSDDASPGISDFEASQRMLRLSSASTKFAGLQRALVARREDAAIWGRAAELQAELAPSATLAGVNGLGQLVFATRGGLQIPLYRLSLSERNAFVFAASIALMGLDRAVILVDTPELGLPTGVAARWIGALRERTPSAQWILATREPELVALAGKGGLVELGAERRPS